MFASMEDELVKVFTPKLFQRIGAVAVTSSGPLTRPIAMLLFGQAQRAAERQHSQTRRDVLKMDEHLESALAFSGHLE